MKYKITESKRVEGFLKRVSLMICTYVLCQSEGLEILYSDWYLITGIAKTMRKMRKIMKVRRKEDSKLRLMEIKQKGNEEKNSRDQKICLFFFKF